MPSGFMSIRREREPLFPDSRGYRRRSWSRTRAFNRRLLDLDFALTVRLVLTRTVSGEDVADNFNQILRPRIAQAIRDMNGSLHPDTLRRFLSYLKVDEVRVGTEIVISCGPAGRLVISVGEVEHPPIDSPVLCRAVFDVYLGQDPVSRPGKEACDRRISGGVGDSTRIGDQGPEWAPVASTPGSPRSAPTCPTKSTIQPPGKGRLRLRRRVYGAVKQDVLLLPGCSWHPRRGVKSTVGIAAPSLVFLASSPQRPDTGSAASETDWSGRRV